MEWFKFYYNKWLSDLGVGRLRPEDRLCFITLLCLASQSDERNGVVLRVDEEQLITLTRLPVNIYDDQKSPYHNAIGCLKRMEDEGMILLRTEGEILIINYEKRQNSQLTGAERAKKYRDSHKESDERNAREEEIREDKRRLNTMSDKSDFDLLWEKYPKKELKKKSKEIWVRKKLTSSLKEIIEFIEKAKLTDRWKKGYIRQLPAFLNGECWNDDLISYNDRKEFNKVIKL